VSEATVDAVRERFAPIGVDIDVSRSHAARYDAVVASDNAGVRRIAVDAIRAIASEAPIVQTEAALIVDGLDLPSAQALWERLQRTGARATICNRDLERYDISLEQAPDTPDMRALLVGQGIPLRVVPRVLNALPVIIRQNAPHAQMQALLDGIAALGGAAAALPHSFQRFALVMRSIKEQTDAIRTLVSFADLPEAVAAAAVKDGKGQPFGSFPRTTALWLQHALTAQGAEAEVELL
jgi:hypothetical protein